MMIKNISKYYLAGLFLSLFMISCCHKEKENKADKVLKNRSDLELVRSYEPQKYRGMVPSDYYTFFGMNDWSRMPLVYPYSIICIDVPDYGSLVNDMGKKDFKAGGSIQPISDYFDKFFFNNEYFIANKMSDPFHPEFPPKIEEYIIFSFLTGSTITITGRNHLNEHLKRINFNTDTSFKSVRQYLVSLHK